MEICFSLKGDFVKVFGQVSASMDENGKVYGNFRVSSLKRLKAIEQIKKSRGKEKIVQGVTKKYTAEKQIDSSGKKEQ